ncbi:MAG: ABC transporter permease [Chloracidobacterium sp.]|nr:ABC transporter permease [Chloracidobacterium sp.]
MQTLRQDLRYGARMLLKKPGFTLTAVITLALGVGATTAIFTVINAVLLRPLPYPNADRLVYVGQTYHGEIDGSGEPKFLFWREQSRSFDALACYSSYGGAQGNLSGGDEAEYVRGVRVSEDFFRALGVYPALGRAFTHTEDAPGGGRVAILSRGLWQRRFGGKKEVLGQTVSFNDQPMTIVGIMPPEFRFGSGVDLFTPMQARRGAHPDPNAEVVGRLKPGVTVEQAQAELKVIAEKYRAAFPRDMQDGESAGAQPYQELFVGDLRRYLWILQGAGGFLSLIACANVANLQLARATTRRREIAVRMALGASGWRIARQSLIESALLAAVGGAAGALLAVWEMDALIAALPEGLLPSVAEIKVDWRVLAFAFGAAIVTGLLFGSAPAWQSREVDVISTLKEGGNKGGSARGRLRGALVVAEVALSLTLMIGAGLLARTFANLAGVAPGFDPRGVLTCQVALEGPRYDTTREEAAFYRDALERIGRLPGVEEAAVTNKLPLDWQFRMPIVLPEKPDQAHMTQFRMISPDYFRAMKIAVRQGRAFTDADNAAAAPVIIVNEAFAQRFFDGQDPLARRVIIGRATANQVVGVVADVKQEGMDKASPPMVFVPIPQLPDRLMAAIRTFTQSYFTIRATGEPFALADAVKREIAAVDSTLAVSQVHTMEEIVGRSVASQRFNMLLVGLFAGLGLALAAVGICGVVSYSVAQRTNEIGVRIALGARAVDVVELVLKQGLALAALGVAIGLAASLALTRLMKGLLFGVSAADPLTFVVIALLLVAVALMAAMVPASRAAKVDPIAALRRE